MNLFEKYEKMKSSGQLFPIGSIWQDEMGEVIVVDKTDDYIVVNNVYLQNHYDGIKFKYTRKYFLDIFTRVS